MMKASVLDDLASFSEQDMTYSDTFCLRDTLHALRITSRRIEREIIKRDMADFGKTDLLGSF